MLYEDNRPFFIYLISVFGDIDIGIIIVPVYINKKSINRIRINKVDADKICYNNAFFIIYSLIFKFKLEIKRCIAMVVKQK